MGSWVILSCHAPNLRHKVPILQQRAGSRGHGAATRWGLGTQTNCGEITPSGHTLGEDQGGTFPRWEPGILLTAAAVGVLVRERAMTPPRIACVAVNHRAGFG